MQTFIADKRVEICLPTFSIWKWG